MTTRSRRPTSADVARLAGVSRTTVSFVLNDTPSQSIPAATREAVRRAAAELGYVPSASATTLRSGRSRLVLVLVPHWASSPMIMRYLELIAASLSAHGLLIVTHIERAAPLKELLGALQPAAVISLVPLEDDDSALLERTGIAEVHAYIADFPGKLESVTLNQQRMGEAQARHLLERGARRIVHVCGPEVGHPLRPAGRIAGARAVIDTSAPATVTFESVSYEDDDGLAALVDAWGGDSLRVGVCAFDDDTALQILAALRARHVAVPDQVAVVGVDDIAAGRFSEPPLTTVHPSLEYQARAVARATLTTLGVGADDLGDAPGESEPGNAAMIVQRGST